LPEKLARDPPNTPGKDSNGPFRAPTGNGTEDRCLFNHLKTPTDVGQPNRKLVTQSDKQKSDQGVVRHGELTTSRAGSTSIANYCCVLYICQLVQ
jgi:hypothetical protein